MLSLVAMEELKPLLSGMKITVTPATGAVTCAKPDLAARLLSAPFSLRPNPELMAHPQLEDFLIDTYKIHVWRPEVRYDAAVELTADPGRNHLPPHTTNANHSWLAVSQAAACTDSGTEKAETGIQYFAANL
jgi:hypothetical protein